MFNLLYIGDVHFRGTNPEHRIDDFKRATLEKLQEVFMIASRYQCRAILCPGDLLDIHSISDGLKLEFSEVLKRQYVEPIVKTMTSSPVDIYTTIGNHEITGYNLEVFETSSLKVLQELTPKLHVMLPDKAVCFADPFTQITFTPYSGKMDKEGYGYCPEIEPTEGFLNIQVSHGMAVSHVPPFDGYSLLAEINTYADLILTGHDHLGYGIYHRNDGKVFCNDGALTRIKASKQEIEREIKVTLITCGDGPYTSACGTKFGLKSIRLECQKPGAEVLDRSAIEAQDQREYAMEQFTALVKTATGEQKTLNIDQVIHQVAKQEAVAPEVVNLCLGKIEFCRLQKGV